MVTTDLAGNHWDRCPVCVVSRLTHGGNER